MSFAFNRAFRGLYFDILDPYKQLILYLGFYFGKNVGILGKRIWPDWGNTARADTAGSGSIGIGSGRSNSG